MAKNTQNSNTDEQHPNQDRADRKVVLLMGMGLNGISAEGWISSKDMIEDLWSLLENVDTFIIGRVTFQMWEQYWPARANDPSSSDFQKRFSLFTDQIQKIVFSTTLKSVTWQNSRVINDNISAEISRIKKLPGKNIVIVGGAGIAQTFSKLNLIDEYQLFLHSMIFGPGKPLLGVLDTERQLELVDTKEYLPDGIRLHFRPIK